MEKNDTKHPTLGFTIFPIEPIVSKLFPYIFLPPWLQFRNNYQTNRTDSPAGPSKKPLCAISFINAITTCDNVNGSPKACSPIPNTFSRLNWTSAELLHSQTRLFPRLLGSGTLSLPPPFPTLRICNTLRTGCTDTFVSTLSFDHYSFLFSDNIYKCLSRPISAPFLHSIVLKKLKKLVDVHS